MQKLSSRIGIALTSADLDISTRLLLRVRGTRENLGIYSPLKYIEYRVYGYLIIRYPKPYSIYLRGTVYGVSQN